MLPGLNYDKDDLRFILLGKVFKFIENEKLMDEYNRCGIHNRSLFLICLKIFFMHVFFSYPISGVVDELNRQSALRNFTGISEVPSETPTSTPSPTPSPTVTTSPIPSEEPSESPTPSPTPAASETPSEKPTESRTPPPTTVTPSEVPSESPTPSPTLSPTPTITTSPIPSEEPTPSEEPEPSEEPTEEPTPSEEPTSTPLPTLPPEPLPEVTPEPIPWEGEEEVELTTIGIRKRWNDEGYNGTRPTLTYVKLYADEVCIEKVELNDENEWFVILEVPKYNDEGNEIVYEWKEVEVPGYHIESTYEIDVITIITNRIYEIPQIPKGMPKPTLPKKTVVFADIDEYETALGINITINHVGDCFD